MEDRADNAVAGGAQTPGPERRRRERRGHRRWRWFGVAVLILLVVGGVVRALLPGWVRDYVNRTLDRNPLYAGTIGAVQLHLWRGAYSIRDIRISKVTGNVPVPLFAAPRVAFAIQWDALLHGKIVGRVLMESPELNFVDAAQEGEDQTGAGGPWLQMIRDLFPFRINSAVIQNGTIHFCAFQSATPVDIYLSEVQATIDNLTNIRDETTPLVSTVQATGLVMDHARLEYKMTLDPFSYRPTFEMGLRVLGLDVTQLNALARTYGKFDFERGWLDLVIETNAKEGQLDGYVKPLFRNLQVFSLSEDLKEGNVLLAFWQALIGATTSLFKNFPRDQFGTLIPFRGDLSQSTSADILATLGNVLRNAFVRAYLPRLEQGQPSGIEFSPPDFTELMAVGGAQ